MNKSTISIDDFAKIEIKVGKVIDCQRAENADKLLLLKFDFGEKSIEPEITDEASDPTENTPSTPERDVRQIVSAIAQWYSPEDLIGRMIPVITNLEPRKFRGYDSQGMILATEKDGKPIPLTPSEVVAPGSSVR